MLNFNSSAVRLAVLAIAIMVFSSMVGITTWSWMMTKESIVWIMPATAVQVVDTLNPFLAFFAVPANSVSNVIQFGQTLAWAVAIVLRQQNEDSEQLNRNVILAMRVGLAFTMIDASTNAIQIALDFNQTIGFWSNVLLMMLIIVLSLAMSQSEEVMLASITVIAYVVMTVIMRRRVQKTRDVASSFAGDLLDALNIGNQESPPSSGGGSRRESRRSSNQRNRTGGASFQSLIRGEDGDS